MALVEMVLPAMGEGVMEATVLSWLKNVGDQIEQDESVLEVATDKVDTEVPATQSGILKEILVNVDDVVKVGAPVAVIETEGEADSPVTSLDDTSVAAKVASDGIPQATSNNQVETAVAVQEESIPTHSGDRFYTPLVKSIAKEEGISVAELDQLNGSGQNGRVTKNDILAYVKDRKSGQNGAVNVAPQAAAAPSPKAVAPAVSVDAKDEIIEMDRVRKMIADRMLDSKRISPHVTSCVEADFTNIVNWRNQWKDIFKKREGASLTFMPIIIHAIAKAIKDFPMINVQVNGNQIIKKADINIGMAVAQANGNLIVPVIKNADRLSLSGLAHQVYDLAIRAREGKLKPEELQGGTYTVSNIGSFGNTIGTPIIMQPQVAIMAVGTIRKKPAVIETPDGDLIGIRQFAYFSHSYDHRVVDGALGGMFVKRVADYLEQWDMKQSI